MSYVKCPACEGTGTIAIDVPVASDVMGQENVECPLCHGDRYVYEDATPLLVERLDEIIEILKRNEEANK